MMEVMTMMATVVVGMVVQERVATVTFFGLLTSIWNTREMVLPSTNTTMSTIKLGISQLVITPTAGTPDAQRWIVTWTARTFPFLVSLSTSHTMTGWNNFSS